MNTIILPKAQAFRYLGLLIGVGFMILSIRVYVNNYLTIENSIKQTQQEIRYIESETDFIKNFQLPYLQSDLAQRNLMHHQQIPQEGGKLVLIEFQTEEVKQKNINSNSAEEEIAREGRVNFIVYQRRRSTKKNNYSKSTP